MKLYILDTSTIAYDPFSFKSFKDNTVVIPITVLEELDKLKKNFDIAGKNARVFLRTLDEIIDTAKTEIHVGIKIDDGITLRVETQIPILEHLGTPIYGDNRILACALKLINENKNKKVVLVSKDIALRIRARSFAIVAQDYFKDNVDVNETSSHHKFITLEDEEINDFYKNNSLDLDDQIIRDCKIKSNNFITLVDKTGQSIAHTRYYSKLKQIKPIQRMKNIFGLSAKNLEQQFAIDLLLDNDVKLVILAGPAGTGKSIISIAAGLFNILEKQDKNYEKLIIMKPIISVGKDLGTLPGEKSDKLSPYLASYKDNLNFLMRNSKNKNMRTTNNIDPYLSLMMENGTIEIEAISYLRGRSLPNSFIIVDEIQNCSIHELKTVLTRIGEGSKIILCGDMSQIDNLNLSSGSNALVSAITKFNDYPIAGSVTLTKGERSELATLASQIL